MPSTARGPFLNSRTRPSTSMPFGEAFDMERTLPVIFDGVNYRYMLLLRHASIERPRRGAAPRGPARPVPGPGGLVPLLAHLPGRQAAPDGDRRRARALMAAVDGAHAARAGRGD